MKHADRLEDIQVSSIRGEGKLKFSLNELELLRKREKIIVSGNAITNSGITNYQPAMTTAQAIEQAGSKDCNYTSKIHIKRIMDKHMILGTIGLQGKLEAGDTITVNCPR
ncbi:MAG: hypothetical protein AAF404_20415 [Pseudomonadota bacterium]